jgi:tripartite-type tricarboxylate transporter receptor subunit TctC
VNQTPKTPKASRRSLLQAGTSLLAAPMLWLPGRSMAAAWPDKVLKIIVPFPPGGTSDVIARLISAPLGELLKTNVIVENKAGANGALGAAAVAQASDEHTMLLSDMSSLAINAAMDKTLPYKPGQLAGATLLAYSPHLLCTHPSVPASNVKELAALSRSKPINIASSGIGSANHLGAVEIALDSDMKFVHIPFKGGAQSIADVAAGNTQLVLNGMVATLPLVQSGRLKLLGVSKRTRMALLPDAPTIAEQGVKDFESGTYQGVAIPANMNKASAERLSAALIQVIRSPDIRARMAALGAEVMTSTPKETSDFLAREGKRWSGLLVRAGKQLEGNA